MLRLLTVVAMLSIASAGASLPAFPIERDVAFGEDPAQRLDLSTPEGRDFPAVPAAPRFVVAGAG